MKKMFLAIAAFALLVTSCNTENEVDGKDKTAMTISLVAETSTRATTAVTQAEENAVTSMTVLVFSAATNVFERKAEISGTTGKITDLTTGSKKIVVFANPSSTLKTQLGEVASYADLNDASKVNLELISQFQGPTDGSMNKTVGLTMTGETTATLVSTAENKVSLSVKRVVAKVKLGTLTITPDAGYDKAKFTLVGVSMQKVRSKSLTGITSYLMPEGSPAQFNYMGGELGSVSTTVDKRLDGSVVEGPNSEYFYVLPNNNDTGNCTLMTIEGTYDGKKQYFVFRINDKAVAGEPATGKFIEANHFYTINVTLKRLGDGSTDPDTPSDPATLEVTITPENWVVVPVQNVAW